LYLFFQICKEQDKDYETQLEDGLHEYQSLNMLKRANFMMRERYEVAESCLEGVSRTTL
jgi:hypothetical protein